MEKQLQVIQQVDDDLGPRQNGRLLAAATLGLEGCTIQPRKGTTKNWDYTEQEVRLLLQGKGFRQVCFQREGEKFESSWPQPDIVVYLDRKWVITALGVAG